MRSPAVVCWLALTLLVPSPGSAQVLGSFADLALRVNVGDQVQIRDQSGVKITGRLTGLTRDAITIQTDAGEQRFASGAVRDVAVRGHALLRGTLIGAGAIMVLGTAAAVRQGNSVGAVFGGIPVGAGAGLAIGALVPQMKTVYRSPRDGAPVAPSAVAPGAQPGPFDDLGLRINLDDEIRIEDQSGIRITGYVTRLTSDAVTVKTRDGEKQFNRETVRQIELRERPMRTAILIGAGVGVALGAVAGCIGPDRSECADAPILMGGMGAGIGAAVGAFLRKRTVVYPEPKAQGLTQTFVLPVISRAGFGIRVSVRW